MGRILVEEDRILHRERPVVCVNRGEFFVLNDTIMHRPIEPSPPIRMTPTVLKLYKESIASNEPETFALLGGSLDDPFLITDFYFLPPMSDANGSYVASQAFVYPDHKMLNYIIDRVLVPNGRYMLGLWHSHPGQFNTPSYQDLVYCSQILANDDSPGRRWRHFLAPITTFNYANRDSISGWILGKGHSAFSPTVVITEIEGKSSSRSEQKASAAQAVTQPSAHTQFRGAPNNNARDTDPKLFELLDALESDFETKVAELSYIEQYHVRRKLAEVQQKIKGSTRK